MFGCSVMKSSKSWNKSECVFELITGSLFTNWDKPKASNTNSDGTDNPDGRQQNRRVEFEIVK